MREDKGFSHLHSIRLMWSTASEFGRREQFYCDGKHSNFPLHVFEMCLPIVEHLCRLMCRRKKYLFRFLFSTLFFQFSLPFLAYNYDLIIFAFLHTFRIKLGLHCDISTKHNISITNVHSCCISTRKVTYARAMSSRMKPWEYGTRHVFKMAGEEILLLLLLLCRCQILFCPQFSYHGCIYFWDLWMFTYQY